MTRLWPVVYFELCFSQQQNLISSNTAIKVITLHRTRTAVSQVSFIHFNLLASFWFYHLTPQGVLPEIFLLNNMCRKKHCLLYCQRSGSEMYTFHVWSVSGQSQNSWVGINWVKSIICLQTLRAHNPPHYEYYISNVSIKNPVVYPHYIMYMTRSSIYPVYTRCFVSAKPHIA